MFDAFKKKLAVLTEPQAKVNNGSVTCAYVDTYGADFAEFNVLLGATDAALTALYIQECDTSGGSYTQVPNTVFGTSNNDTGSASTLPTSSSGNNLYTILVDCRGGRKRYLQPVITVADGSTGAYVAVLAELTRLEQSPATAVAAGIAQRLIA